MCVYACVCAGASGSEFRVFHWEPLPPNQAAAAGESVWNNPMVDMLVCVYVWEKVTGVYLSQSSCSCRGERVEQIDGGHAGMCVYVW